MELINMQLNHRVDGFAHVISNGICNDLLQNEIGMESAMLQVMTHLRQLRANQNTLYIIGNGGSAAVASHALVDFVNVAKIKAQVLHDSSLITCMANDFGYENAYSRVLAQFIKPNDMLIAISSSGKSVNICNAAKIAKECGAAVITYSGFNADNPLRKIGDYNFWLASDDYGYVEVGHQFMLHNLSDRFAVQGKNEALAKDKALIGSRAVVSA